MPGMGIITVALQFGHCATEPAKLSAVSISTPHLEHVNLISDIGTFPLDVKLTGYTGTSNTRYRCRYRNRSRAYSILDYRSADSDSDYEYDKYNFLYYELNPPRRKLFWIAGILEQGELPCRTPSRAPCRL